MHINDMKRGVVMTWWKSTTLYQIYPRSFYDSNGDGIGDLNGIIQKLDYLKDLGIEAIWISPFYPSPQRDHGYDITDYRGVDPLFGTMEDLRALIEAVHNKGMKIVMDMVMNHTSNEHPWFKESRSSLNNPKRDWYIWSKGKGKKPPNNWMSMIGKKGWSYDEGTGEWYYSSFLDFQPDLNYDNPEVREEMFNTVRFWLNEGIDGFRLDIFNCIGKDMTLEDNPFSFRYLPSPAHNEEAYFQKKIHTYNHPKSFEYAKALRRVVDEWPERFLVGEITGDDDTLKKFIGAKQDGLHTVFLFELVHFSYSKTYFEGFLKKVEREYPEPYVPTYVFSNHDIGRGIIHVKNDMEKAKVLALFQLTVRGIPVMYYGDEIGMGIHDLKMKSSYDPIAIQNRHIPKKLARALGVFLNRDDCRTPMQWDGTSYAGFSSSQAWLDVIPNYKIRNVEAQSQEPESLLNMYRGLLKLRNSLRVFQDGVLEIIENPDLLVYKRKLKAEVYTVVINFSNSNTSYLGECEYEIVFTTNKLNEWRGERLQLASNSGCILKG
jgi:oligo-1,6-glucosidase/alpha-glucosidase